MAVAASKAQRAETAERRAKAIKLKLAGWSYQQIATELHYTSYRAVWVDINRALEARLKGMTEAAEVLRQQEVDRLDRAQAAIWQQVLKGDVRAGMLFVKYVERRCRILGLDAATKVEVVTMDAIEREIATLQEQLAVNDRPEVTDDVPATLAD
jgi:hypothetical protein